MNISDALFYDGVSGHRYKVMVAFEPSVLTIYDYQELPIRINKSEIRFDQSDSRFLTGSFEHNAHQAQFRIELDRDIRRALGKLGYLNFFKSLSLSRWLVFWGLVALVLPVLAGFYLLAPKLSKAMANKISIQTEIRWYKEKTPLPFQGLECKLSDQENQALLKLTDRIFPPQSEAGFYPKVTLINLPVANAFATLGGKIYVSNNLLDTIETQEELAAVLAHEYQHIHQRHLMQQLIQTSFFAFGLAALSGDFSFFMGAGLVDFITLKFSQEMEAEADYGALAMLYKAGLNPGSLGDFFEHLEETEDEDSEASDSKLLSYFSTHPPTEDRIQMARAYPEPIHLGPTLTGQEWDLLKRISCTTGDQEKLKYLSETFLED